MQNVNPHKCKRTPSSGARLLSHLAHPGKNGTSAIEANDKIGMHEPNTLGTSKQTKNHALHDAKDKAHNLTISNLDGRAAEVAARIEVSAESLADRHVPKSQCSRQPIKLRHDCSVYSGLLSVHTQPTDTVPTTQKQPSETNKEF